MKRVIIESPLKGSRRKNEKYARACMLDSLKRGEAPFASHLLYTQMLDDDVPDERALGIEAGLCWGGAAELTAAYVDYGVSDGMKLGIARAKEQDREVEMRTVDGWEG